jgi:hypothetical protein
MFNEQYGATLVPLTMSSAVIEIDQYSPGWRLARLPGEDAAEQRIFKTHVPFAVPFANVPMVHIGLTGFDIDNRDTARLSVRAGEISATGFDLLVLTWLNTRVYKVEISWIALGHQATF